MLLIFFCRNLLKSFCGSFKGECALTYMCVRPFVPLNLYICFPNACPEKLPRSPGETRSEQVACAVTSQSPDGPGGGGA